VKSNVGWSEYVSVIRNAFSHCASVKAKNGASIAKKHPYMNGVTDELGSPILLIVIAVWGSVRFKAFKIDFIRRMLGIFEFLSLSVCFILSERIE
jgi:hypothetical protein